MTEIAIAEELYRQARIYADDHGAVRLQAVRLAVGELLGVDLERLRAAWHFVVEESIDQDSVIEVEVRQTRIRCSRCGPISRPDAAVPRFCPKCHRSLHAEGGKEMEVLTMAFELEVTEDAGPGGRH